MLGTVLSPAPTKQVNGNFSFRDIEPASGVQFILNNSASPRKHQIETMISGVALFDYNNDGLLDIFFVNGAAIPSLQKDDPKFYNRLYRNNGDGTFTDVTQRAGVQGVGYSMGVAIADYDNDGFEDIYVTGVNRNQLLHNNGDGTFTDVTARAGVTGVHAKYGKTWAMSAGWFDYNNDGKLDLLVTNYVAWDPANEPSCEVNRVPSYCSPDKYQGLAQFPVSKQWRWHFHGRIRSLGHRSRLARAWAWRLPIMTATAFRICSSPTTRFEIFCSTTIETAHFQRQGVVAG